MNKVLITGGVGFIGVQVAMLFVEQRRPVLLFDNLNRQIHGMVPDLSSLSLLKNPDVEVFRGDVRDASDWEKALDGVDCVIHLAAETGTGQSMYEISHYVDTNTGGTAKLLNYLANRKHRVSKVILASSRSVYGEGAYHCERCGVVYPPMRSEKILRSGRWEPQCPACQGQVRAIATPEWAQTRPASIYAATKLAQEDLVRVACEALGIAFVILRFQNVYGEGQSLKNPYTGIFSIFSNQIRANKTLNLYEDGQESRDFVHVVDVAHAVQLAVMGDGADGRTLNVGSGIPTTVEQIALLLIERLGTAARPVVSGQFRHGDIRHGFADIAALYGTLGYVPKITLEQGLTRFVDWVKKQPVEPDRLETATHELVCRNLMIPQRLM